MTTPAFTVRREQAFRGRTTAEVSWVVVNPAGKDIQTCKTRREANEWVDVYTLTREGVWAKHPHLKP